MSGSVLHSLCENTPERVELLLTDFILCAEWSLCVCVCGGEGHGGGQVGKVGDEEGGQDGALWDEGRAQVAPNPRH